MTRYYIEAEAHGDSQTWQIRWGHFVDDGQADKVQVTSLCQRLSEYLHYLLPAEVYDDELVALRHYGYWNTSDGSMEACCISKEEYERLNTIKERDNAYNRAWELLRQHRA